MSRYRKALTKDNIKFLLENSSVNNQKLAKQLKTTPSIIATYKYRARKAGVPIPRQKRRSEIDKEINEINNETEEVKDFVLDNLI